MRRCLQRDHHLYQYKLAQDSFSTLQLHVECGSANHSDHVAGLCTLYSLGNPKERNCKELGQGILGAIPLDGGGQSHNFISKQRLCVLFIL
jgi:hypothetical protein